MITTATNKKGQKTTGINLTAEELGQVAKLLTAGQLMLGMSYPVTARFKRALTTMGLPTPKGL